MLLVCIIGPTGSGKSKLAIKVAQKFNGEIINCDSRQVYRFMDIGTAKPSPDELSQVPHHLISIINPDEELSLASYLETANHSIRNIDSRGKLPIFTGGTGQYFWAVTEGWEVPRVVPDASIRKSLELEAESRGTGPMFEELTRVDPEAAKKIDPRNVRRVIRALEVYRSRGVPFSQLKVKKSPPFKSLIIGLTVEREELYRRVDERVDRMIKCGLVDEVKKLLEMGYRDDLPAMSGIGYRQIVSYLNGGLSLEEATQQIKFGTHRYVRQQYAWFRLKDERIHWFNITDDAETGATDLIRSELT
jgi:tRNA dimethylallyltransferase